MSDEEKTVRITLNVASIEGNMRVPANAGGVVLFAH
jgi:hypothetical protein